MVVKSNWCGRADCSGAGVWYAHHLLIVSSVHSLSCVCRRAVCHAWSQLSTTSLAPMCRRCLEVCGGWRRGWESPPRFQTSTSLPPPLLRVRRCDIVLEGAVPLRTRRLLRERAHHCATAASSHRATLTTYLHKTGMVRAVETILLLLSVVCLDGAFSGSHRHQQSYQQRVVKCALALSCTSHSLPLALLAVHT